MSVPPGLIQQSGDVLREDVLFRVHFVIRDLVRSDGFECTLSDVQGQFRPSDAVLLQCGKNLSGEMKSGSRGGNRARRFCINSLIPFRIGWQALAFDVRRKGNMSAFVKNMVDGCSGKLHDAFPGGIFGDNRYGIRGVRFILPQESERGTGGSAFSGFEKTAPAARIRLWTQEHDLYMSTGIFPGKQARPDYAGIVDGQAVAGPEIIGDPVKRHDFACPCFGVKNHHPGIAAMFGRILGDELFRESVIKIRGAHRCTSSHIRRLCGSRRNRWSCRCAASGQRLPDDFSRCRQPSGSWRSATPR